MSLTWDGVLAGLASVLALSPLMVAAMRMGHGEFPPMFLNVDSPYFLEKSGDTATRTPAP